MSILDMFKPSNAPAPAAPQAPAAPANPTQTAVNNDPTIPSPNQTLQQLGADGKPVGESNPLAQFDKLWDTAANPADGTGEAFTFDEAKFGEAIGKVNFVQPTQEQYAALQQGGEAAAKVQVDLMNQAARQAFAQGARYSTKLSNGASTHAQAHFQKNLPGAVKSQLVNTELSASMPGWDSPAVKPVVDALATQFQRQFPNASQAEIRDHVKTFMTEAGKMAAGPQAPAPTTPGEYDWGNALGLEN